MTTTTPSPASTRLNQTFEPAVRSVTGASNSAVPELLGANATWDPDTTSIRSTSTIPAMEANRSTGFFASALDTIAAIAGGVSGLRVVIATGFSKQIWWNTSSCDLP